MPTTNPTSLYSRLSADQKATVKGTTDFFYAVESFANRGLIQNVGTLIDRLLKSGQFENDLEGLMPKLDYEGACDGTEVQVVEGSKDTFYFDWAELLTIEMDGEDSMIHWRAFAQENGLDLNAFAWDTSTSKVIPVDALEKFLSDPDAQGAEPVPAEGDVMAGFIDDMGPDAEDMAGFLAEVARLSGNDALADKLEKQNAREMRALLSKHINNDFTSSQSNHDKQDAFKNACEEYNLRVDYSEIMEHWSVDSRFAQLLEAQGEVIADDVMGLTIWGRTSTGQSVALDHVVREAFVDSSAYDLDEVVRKVLPEVAATLDAEIEAERTQSREINAPTLG